MIAIRIGDADTATLFWSCKELPRAASYYRDFVMSDSVGRSEETSNAFVREKNFAFL